MNLEDILKNYRNTEHLSMQEFANKCGLSKGYISMLEKGKHPQSNRPLVPSLTTLNALASGMNISIDALLSMMNADSLVSVNDPTPAEWELTYNEQTLIQDYRSLNPQGQAAALAAVHGLTDNPIFKKGNSSASGAMDA